MVTVGYLPVRRYLRGCYPMSTSPISAPDELVGHLAARVARRDQPPPPDEHTFTPDRVRQRLEDTLAALVPGRNARGRATQAHMCYVFLEREACTAAQLAAGAGVGRVAGSHAHTGLVRAGLLRFAYEGPRRVFRLTRFGEDWLLAVARNEHPPVAPLP